MKKPSAIAPCIEMQWLSLKIGATIAAERQSLVGGDCI